MPKPRSRTMPSASSDAAPASVRGVKTELFLQISNVTLDAGVAAGTAGMGTEMRFRKVGKVMRVARTTAQELQAAMASRFPFLQDPVITFNAGQFTVTGRLRDGGQPASLRGRFIIRRPAPRAPARAPADPGPRFPVPLQLVEAELAKINPVLDLSKSPIPLRVRVIALHDNRIEVLAGTD